MQLSRATFWLAILIMVLGAALRMVGIANYPPGPHFDEAVEIIITRTLAFSDARPFPMVENYQGREVLFYYLAVPFTWWIQDGRFGLQVASLFCGILTVALTFRLARSMFPNRGGHQIALAASLMMAVSFPQVWLARQIFRTSALPLLQTGSLLLLWKALTRRSFILLIIGGMVGGMVVYTYNSSRLFPFWLLLTGLFLWLITSQKWLRFRQGVAFFLPLGVVALPMAVYAFVRPDVFWGRLMEVTAGKDAVTLWESVQLHARMFFVEGEALLRYNPPGRPYLMPWEGAFLLVGGLIATLRLFRLPSSKSTRNADLQRATYFLLLLSPLMVIPSVISTGGLPPNHMRSIGMIPLIFILAAVGWERLTRPLATRWRRVLLVIWMVLGGTVTARDYAMWATRQDLYYDTDADLALASQWLAGHMDERVYIAARELYHPTVQIANLPNVRWLGADTFFLPKDDRYSALAIFPRSAPKPSWITQASEPVPLDPHDGQPIFEAIRVSSEMTLPDTLHPTDELIHNDFLRLTHTYHDLAFPNGMLDIDTAWDIKASPNLHDLTPIVQIVDRVGNILAHQEGFLIGTNEWQTDERLVVAVRGLQIPLGTPADTYSVRMRWVGRSSGEFVFYRDAEGAGATLWRTVGTVEVLQPAQFPPSEALPAAYRAEREVLNGINFVGWDAYVAQVRPSESLPLVLYWQARPTDAPRVPLDYSLVLVAQNGEQFLLSVSSAMLPRHSAEYWVSGQLMRDSLRASIPNDMEHGEYELALAFPNSAPLTLGTVTIEGVARNFTAPDVEKVVEVPLGDGINLYGYTIEVSETGFEVRLVWHATRQPSQSYKVFVHLLDSQQQLIVQQDQIPDQNQYPTSLWQAGEFIDDAYQFAVDHSVDSIVVGMYSLESGQRLGTPSDHVVYLR